MSVVKWCFPCPLAIVAPLNKGAACHLSTYRAFLTLNLDIQERKKCFQQRWLHCSKLFLNLLITLSSDRNQNIFKIYKKYIKIYTSTRHINLVSFVLNCNLPCHRKFLLFPTSINRFTYSLLVVVTVLLTPSI